MENLTKKTYLTYAMHSYTNPSCTGLSEFQDDLVRVKYIKRLLHRYVRTGEIPTRLLLNHIINLYNVFTPEAVARMLFLRVHPDAWSALKTTLQFLNLMPARLLPINGIAIYSINIPTDYTLYRLLTDDTTKVTIR